MEKKEKKEDQYNKEDNNIVDEDQDNKAQEKEQVEDDNNDKDEEDEDEDENKGQGEDKNKEEDKNEGENLTAIRRGGTCNVSDPDQSLTNVQVKKKITVLFGRSPPKPQELD